MFLKNVFFCETKVVSKFNLVFFCETKVVSSHFGGIFFLSRVSKVKNSCFLTKIHHMLGFNRSLNGGKGLRKFIVERGKGIRA